MLGTLTAISFLLKQPSDVGDIDSFVKRLAAVGKSGVTRSYSQMAPSLSKSNRRFETSEIPWNRSRTRYHNVDCNDWKMTKKNWKTEKLKETETEKWLKQWRSTSGGFWVTKTTLRAFCSDRLRWPHFNSFESLYAKTQECLHFKIKESLHAKICWLPRSFGVFRVEISMLLGMQASRAQRLVLSH